jgi:hypothetical protein
MRKTARSLAWAFAGIVASAGLTLLAGTALANGFVFDEKMNREVAGRLGIPVYFALPVSTRAPLSRRIDTTDRLVDFRHLEALRLGASNGLRLIMAKREGLAERLARSGLVKTGDLLLTFRPEWGGAGAYPNVQMGISHTGLAYVKNGKAHNIDNPLDEEFIGEGRVTELNSEFYNSIGYVHIVRPRNLTGKQRRNIAAWATRLNDSAERIFPDQIDFNEDYNDPKFKRGTPLTFVKQLGQIALGQRTGKVAMFCSEFAWSLLALRDCDPDQNLNAFNGDGMPACVTPAMRPMHATGDVITSKRGDAYSGLADGPLLVAASLPISREKRDRMLQSIFVADPEGMKKMSEGHQVVAKSMQERFAKLETYYRSAASGAWLGVKAKVMGAVISNAIPANYSPASFLVNTLLPRDNPNRTMDYVATIVFDTVTPSEE